jgi:hypothetical protein
VGEQLDGLARNLPMEESALQASIAPLEKMALADWKEATVAFDSFTAWRDVLGALQTSLQERR